MKKAYRIYTIIEAKNLQDAEKQFDQYVKERIINEPNIFNIEEVEE